MLASSSVAVEDNGMRQGKTVVGILDLGVPRHPLSLLP